MSRFICMTGGLDQGFFFFSDEEGASEDVSPAACHASAGQMLPTLVGVCVGAASQRPAFILTLKCISSRLMGKKPA